MEQTEVNILDIDLSAYLNEIETLREVLKGLSKDSEEYTKITEQIKSKQRELANEIADVASSFKGLKEAQELNNVLMAEARLDANEYAESINGVKQHIKDLETIANSMDFNSDAYATVTAEIKKMKDSLKELQGQTAEARLAADDYGNTLNGMRQKLSDLKVAIGNADFGSEAYKELTKQTKILNDEISKAEQSYGVFSRNVGNYANSFKEAFSDMSLSVDNVAQKTEGIVNGMAKAKNAAMQFVEYMRKGFAKDVIGWIKNATNGIKNFGTNFKNAYNEATKGGKGVINSFKGITAGIKASTSAVAGFNTALIPIIATVGAIAAAVALVLAGFAAIKMAIDEDEESTREWNDAMADVHYYWDMLKNLMIDFGQGLLKVVIPAIKKCSEFAIGFINNIKLGLAYLNELLGNDDYAAQLREEVAQSEKMRDLYHEIAQKENELTDLKRKNLEKIQDIEKKIQENRQKMNDKDKLTAAERLKAEEEITKLEKEKNNLLTEEKKLQNEILQLESQKSANNKAMNDALAKSNAELKAQENEIDRIDADSIKRRQKILAEEKAQRKEEMQATIQYYELVEKNNKKGSKEYEEAHRMKLKLSYQLRKEEIEDAKYSAQVKKKLLEELNNEMERENIVLEFDTSSLDEQYKDVVAMIQEMPEISKDAYNKMIEATEAYKKHFIDAMKEVAEKANPRLDVKESFFGDLQAALKDMSQNYIPLTMENVSKYLKTIGKELTKDQTELLQKTSDNLNISMESVFKTIQSFNSQLETLKNKKELSVLNKELDAINQSLIILDTSYRNVMHTFETEDFVADVVQDFKDGKFSLQGYLTELNRYTHVTLAQIDVLKNHKKILEEVEKIQKKRKEEADEEVKVLKDKLESDKTNVKLQKELNVATEKANKLNDRYLDTQKQIKEYTQSIDEIEAISINKFFNFDESDINDVEEELTKLFKNIDVNDIEKFDTTIIKIAQEAKDKIKSTFADIYNGVIPSDTKSIESAVEDLRTNIKTLLESISKDLKINVDEKLVNDIINNFIPSTEMFKKKATEAKQEVETITQDILKSEMKWYDEGNKKILQAEQTVLQARKQLEIEHKKIIRDETVEQRQQRIYEATVAVDKAILKWEETFFEERQKQFDKYNESQWSSVEQVEYHFKQERKVLDKAYKERLDLVEKNITEEKEKIKELNEKYNATDNEEEKAQYKQQLDEMLAMLEENEKAKLDIISKYKKEKENLENNEKGAKKEVVNSSDPIEQLALEIDQMTKQLEEWYAKRVSMAQGNADELIAIEEERARRQKEIDEKLAEENKLTLQKRIKQTQFWANATGKLFGLVSQYMEQDIEDKKKKGEATEEEMHKEFELMKAFQVSAAIIDTLAGALGIYMSYLAAPGLPWVNQALGWTSMGLALASGFLQVQQIESTRFGESNTTAGGISQIAATPVSYQPVTVAPLLDEQADAARYTSINVNPNDNESKQEDIYILESDLQASSRRVQIRESSSRF